MLSWAAVRCLLLAVAVCLPFSGGSRQGLKDAGCGTVTASAGSQYRFPTNNPAVIAPVFMNYDVQKYSSPLQAVLKDSSLVVEAPADMVANFNLTANANSTGSVSGVGEKYILSSIEIRKPGETAVGLGQALNHELEVVLVHKEVTGTGYWANVIIPFEVGVDPGFNILAPLVNQAELPTKVGETKPVLVTNTLPLNLAAAFENASFQQFWTTVQTSCNQTTAGARIIMRNRTLTTSKDIMTSLLGLLKWAPGAPAFKVPVSSWLMGACPRGSTCKSFTAQDQTNLYNKAEAEKNTSLLALEAAYSAMNDALSDLSNNTNVTNAEYDTAVAARGSLRNAQSAYDESAKLAQELENDVNAANTAVWDADAPASLKSGNTSQSSSAASSSAATITTTSAPSSNGSAAALLATDVQGCEAKSLASPLEVDLDRDAEHVDASKAGTSEAILFWRLSASTAQPAAEAAAAEAAAEAPLLHLANLGDKLRVSMPEQGKPVMVLYVHGQELPVSYADVTVPAVHAKDGKRPAAEIQIVHTPASGKAVAVAIQLDEVSDADDDAGGNKWLGSFTKGLPKKGQIAEVRSADPMTVHGALTRGVAGRYFRYSGKLQDDSPCLGATWHVLEERGQISSQQLAELRQVLQAPGSPVTFQAPTALRTDLLAKVKRTSFLQQGLRPLPQEALEPMAKTSPSLKSLLLSLPRRAAKSPLAP